MNINDLFTRNSDNAIYASSFRRSAATMIDMWIVLFIRVIVMQFLATIWLNQAIVNFIQEFSEIFGTETVKNTPEHIAFVVQHKIFIYAIIFYSTVILSGAVYYAYFNSSAWKASIGKRLMKIMMIKENDSKISFKSGLAHYFLSILPFAYLFYLLSFQLRNDLTFYNALTYSSTNLFLGIVFVIWVQIHLFTKKKTTAYDMICKTIFINGKTEATFPWTKEIDQTS